MFKTKTIYLAMMTGGMELLERYSALVKLFLRPVANAPFLSRKIPVLVRATMGATAFEIHDVDLKNGRIGIGGVEEIMAGSKIVDLLHSVFRSRLGEVGKNQALYELGTLKVQQWKEMKPEEEQKQLFLTVSTPGDIRSHCGFPSSYAVRYRTAHRHDHCFLCRP